MLSIQNRDLQAPTINVEYSWSLGSEIADVPPKTLGLINNATILRRYMGTLSKDIPTRGDFSLRRLGTHLLYFGFILEGEGC